MKKWNQWTAHFVVKYRWWLIIGNFALFIALIIGGMKPRGEEFNAHVAYMEHIRQNPLDVDSNHTNAPPIFNPSYKVFFDSTNSDLIAFDQLQEIFSSEDMIIAVVKSKSGNLFTNQNLQSLRKLTDKAWEIPYIARVNSLANFNYTTVEREFIPAEERIEGDEEYIDNLLVDDFITGLPYSDSLLEMKKSLALNDSLMPKFLISPKGDVTQISLRAIIPEAFAKGFMEARKGMEKLSAEIQAENPDLEIKLAGTVILNTSFEEFAQHDMKTMIPVMFLFIIIVMIITLRSFWGTLLPMGLLLSSIVFPILLFVGFFKMYLTSVSMNVVQILVAVAIADSIHIMAIYYRELRKGKSRREAVTTTIEKNYLACLITSLTTAIGFFSLLLMDMPPFRHLGLFAGFGTLYAFWASLYVLPAMMLVLPAWPDRLVESIYQKTLGRFFKSSDTPKDQHPLFIRLEKLIIKKSNFLRIATFITLALSAYGVSLMVMDNSAIKYFKEGTTFREATEEIERSIIGTVPVEFLFDSKEENGIYNPQFLSKIEKFQNYISHHPELHITYTSAITDVVKRLNKTMNGDQDSEYRIPTKDSVTAEGDTLYARRLISQYLFLYQMSLPRGMDLTNQISIDNSKTRVTAFMSSVASSKQLKAVEELNAFIQREMPEVGAVGVGVPVMFAKMFLTAIPGMMKSLIVSLILITLCLIFTFKSMKFGLMSMIPNIWPVLILFGIVGFSGYIVDMSVAVVGMITLGIAVDDSVHFMVKYLNFRRKGMTQGEAIQETFHQTGPALFFTSVILIAGFGVLMLSNFALNANLGKFCSAIIALALFADFVLLPAFLMLFDRDKNKSPS